MGKGQCKDRGLTRELGLYDVILLRVEINSAHDKMHATFIRVDIIIPMKVQLTRLEGMTWQGAVEAFNAQRFEASAIRDLLVGAESRQVSSRQLTKTWRKPLQGLDFLGPGSKTCIGHLFNSD